MGISPSRVDFCSAIFTSLTFASGKLESEDSLLGCLQAYACLADKRKNRVVTLEVRFLASARIRFEASPAEHLKSSAGRDTRPTLEYPRMDLLENL
jgi:hypothetical protein